MNSPAGQGGRAGSVQRGRAQEGPVEQRTAKPDLQIVVPGIADAAVGLHRHPRDRDEPVGQVRLGVLEHKRRAITELRDQRRIDDIVLLELQASMDLEEARLLGPSGPD